jgi:glycine/D-amino acid oxidase-like deaminating enzyme
LTAAADPAFYRSRSLWLDRLDGDPLTPRAPLDGPLDVDVAIVGAGFTGLWTAYYLHETDRGLRIAVVERDIAGFGASGRNGGWCSALLPMGLSTMQRRHGRDAAIAMQAAMHATVDEVGRVAAAEGIDCQFAKGGWVHLATAPLHLARLHHQIDEARRFGFGEEDLRWLELDEAAAMVRATGVLGAAFTPHCAAIQPARLVRGLASVVERRGVAIHEGTSVRSLGPGVVDTDRGRLRAPVVVRATEGFTPELAGEHRTVAPVYSLMVATAPLSDAQWSEIGLADRPTFNDARHLIIYGQRTADGRIAFGGRGAPYHFGSRVDAAFDRDERVFADLRRVVRSLFPVLEQAEFTHAWGGPLAIPRDWHATVGLDRTTCLAWAGGYVGDGVAASNLAGRTLADLVTGQVTDLTRLAWVDHRSRRWEPEPLRWLGINGALRLTASADASEQRTGRPARLRTRVLRYLTG